MPFGLDAYGVGVLIMFASSVAAACGVVRAGGGFPRRTMHVWVAA
eukprot:gene50669-64145_t